MRIVSVCRVYPTQRPGGMPFVCQDRARELVRHGHDVHVLTTGFGKPNPLVDDEGAIDDQGVTVHHLRCMPQAYSAEFAEECKAKVDRLCPDAVHLDSFDRERLWWLDLGRVPVVITMHGFEAGAMLTLWNQFSANGERHSPSPEWAGWHAMRREAWALPKATRVIAISRHEEHLLKAVYCLTNVRLAYNPIATEFFSRSPVPPAADAPILSAAISGHDRRRFGMAAEIARIAGREIVIASKVPRAEMPALYERCAAVLLPTLYSQGYDLTVAEAGAVGRPVICSPIGSYAMEPEACVLAKGLGVSHFVDALRAELSATGEEQAGRADALRLLSTRHTPTHHVRRWLEAL